MYAVEMSSSGMIYLQIFMNIGSGFQAILRFCLRNLKGCNVGITDRGIYEVRRCGGLRWVDMRTKFHDDRSRHLRVSNIMVIKETI
jgi:hypothetical protein